MLRKFHIVGFSILIYLSAGCAQAQEPASTKSDIDTFKDCEACPEMVVIPKGEVMIGAYETEAYRRNGERPKQKAKIGSDFALAKYETTLGQFRQFMGETGHVPKIIERNGEPLIGCNWFDGKGYGYVAGHSWDNVGFPQREDSPVVCVSWSDADAFVKWLSDKTDRTYRVPSTVEFEYAFRAGAETPWAWGTNPSKACEYANIADETFVRDHPKRPSFNCDDQYKYVARVGKFKPNAFGLHDMLGNAWEWTNDCWHTDLKNAPLDGSSWLEQGGGDCTARTPKGGGWISGPAWARASVRSKDGADYRSFMLGFRVAAELK